MAAQGAVAGASHQGSALSLRSFGSQQARQQNCTAMHRRPGATQVPLLCFNFFAERAQRRPPARSWVFMQILFLRSCLQVMAGKALDGLTAGGSHSPDAGGPRLEREAPCAAP